MIDKQKFVNGLVAEKLAKQWQASETIRREKEKTLKLLNEFIFSCTFDEFNDKDAIIFVGMHDGKKSGEEIEAFARDNIPDYDEFIEEVFAEFKELYPIIQSSGL